MSSQQQQTNPTSPSLIDSTYAPSDDVIHNGEAWASSPSLDPWDPVILALDGGGIRGYSSLLILSALMHRVSVWEKRLEREASSRSPSNRNSKVIPNGNDGGDHPRPYADSLSPASTPPPVTSEAPPTYDEEQLLPCHYFDFMYGTSTGGLIATMLGRLRMTVPQCLDVYRVVGDDLFGRRRSYAPLATKYHHRPLEEAVREIVRKHCKQHLEDGACPGDDWHAWRQAIPHDPALDGVDLDANICQSICLTAVKNQKIDEAHLLRTYSHRYMNIPNFISPYNEGADELRIWQVTRATSAAPFYFKSLEADLRGEKWIFKDGGIRENNPAGAAWSEFVSLHGEGKDPAMLLSIGTGRPDESQDGFASSWPGPFGKSSFVRKAAEKFAVVKNVLVKYTEGEKTHIDMRRLARGENSWYKRLNVSTGLQSLPLDAWKRGKWLDPADGTTKVVPGGATLTEMERVTAAYLARELDHDYDTYAAPSIMLDQTAEKLVRQRRARQATAHLPRSANAKRWDTYMGKYLTGQFMDKVDGPVVHPIKRRKSSRVALV